MYRLPLRSMTPAHMVDGLGGQERSGRRVRYELYETEDLPERVAVLDHAPEPDEFVTAHAQGSVLPSPLVRKIIAGSEERDRSRGTEEGGAHGDEEDWGVAR